MKTPSVGSFVVGSAYASLESRAAHGRRIACYWLARIQTRLAEVPTLALIGRGFRRVWLAPGVIPLAVAVMVLALAFLSPAAFSSWPTTELGVYLVQPILWLALAFIAWIAAPARAKDSRLSRDKWLVYTAVAVALLQIVLLMMGGILSGYASSPYARAPLLLLLNLWFIGAQVLGMERARWCLLGSSDRSGPILGYVVAWGVVWVSLVGPGLTGHLNDGESTLQFVANTMIPAAASGALATYLCVLRGPLASFSYVILLKAFEWLSPIVPDLNWGLAGFIGTAAPIIGILLIQDVVAWRKEPRASVRRASHGVAVGKVWVIATMIGVFAVWFNTGLFGFHPLLVSGYSMNPSLHMGDVVITRKASAAEVGVGDVVQYVDNDGRSSVLHRLIDIREEDGRTVYITKGDNNAVEDFPVQAEQIQGKLVLSLPLIGWIPIGIRSAFDWLFSVLGGG